MLPHLYLLAAAALCADTQALELLSQPDWPDDDQDSDDNNASEVADSLDEDDPEEVVRAPAPPKTYGNERRSSHSGSCLPVSFAVVFCFSCPL